ncbi:serine protease inhibitor 27A [Episyrphus balteatus]|uniref:serine protease inhibitor 27A n=1 Tax=Episyrphus balteatus TaxID=286459 RepID=UPI00248566D2|nr:serine protease inhibitor 27A [Episyrphus balteatus]
MLSNTVLVVFLVGIFALCQASQPTNKVKTDAEVESSIADIFNTATPSDEITTSSSPTKKPAIDDRDYWDNDDFKPYKVDKRDYFDWRLLEKVFTNTQSNVVISPFSVKFVLALLYEAADAESNTKTELSSVFYGSPSTYLMRDVYRDMLESLKEPNTKYILNIATKMYLRNNITPRPQYRHTLMDQYDTDIQNLDFSKAEESADIINKWCSNVTEGRLKELVTSDQIQSAGLLLINAIYFDGQWRTPFTSTFESAFFRLPNEQIRANYMTVTGKFYYFYSTMLNAKVLRLPYQGKKFSMTILLPGAKGGLEALARDIEGDGLRRIQWLMSEQEVKVTLPKFKFDYTAKLKETLMALGLNEIFTESAALSGIAKGSALDRKMKVTNIIQKAGIEVHEKGSTAFAVTEVEIVNKFGGDNIEEFNVNRPFVFLIVDELTSTIIFAGKVLDPTV